MSEGEDLKVAADAAPEHRFPIVAVGLGVGGVPALGELFRGLRGDGMAFVVVYQPASLGDAIRAALRETTALPVAAATGGAAIQPGRIYLAPAGQDLALLGGNFHLLDPISAERGRLPIDFFMRSLASERGSSGIGVLLAGPGSDGLYGLQAIKAEGGVTYVQDPITTPIDGASRRALQATSADVVLRPAEIGDELRKLSAHPYLAAPGGGARVFQQTPAPTRETQEELGKLFAQIRATFGTDLGYYKPSTIERRIERQMALHRIERLPEYVRFVTGKPKYLEALYHDCLIGVTSFFRDHEPFEVLKSTVFPRIVDRKRPGAAVRIWVPGCSTGEEPYSIAMCVLEFLDGRAPDVKVQIFASDLDAEAVQRARRGMYPPNIAEDVSQARLTRFFVKREGEYQITRRIRDIVVFADQDVTKDPPFSHVDLISCRNLLIYLQAPVQKRVLRIFHYALNPDGALLLGSSETIGDSGDLYSIIDKQQKIYVRKNIAIAAAFEPHVPPAPTRRDEAAPRAPSDARPVMTLLQLADRKVLERYGPAGVLINENFDVLQFRGRIGMYLDPMPGTATLNLLKLARPELIVDLRTLVRSAQTSNGPVGLGAVNLRGLDGPRPVSIEVLPLQEPETRSRCFLVLFEERNRPELEPPDGAPAAAEEVADRERERELERELQATKDYLQSTVEEVESANEELKSSNEELQSSNEELQSTNEELETSKEELQSSNEELNTVNDELHSRMTELSVANDDLHNFLSATGEAMVIIGMDLRIRRFTHAAERLLKLMPADVGRAAGYLQSFVSSIELEPMILESIDKLAERQKEAPGNDNRWYSVRVVPYRTADHTIRGAVVTFSDVDSSKRRQEMRTHVDRNAAGVLDAIASPMLLVDKDLRVLWANARYRELFRVTDREVIGKLLQNLGAGQWAEPKLGALLEHAIRDGEPFRHLELKQDFEHLGTRTFLVSGNRILDEQGEPVGVLAIEEQERPGERP